MPRLRSSNRNDDERQVLVQNEHNSPPTLDNDFGGDNGTTAAAAEDDDDHFVAHSGNFTPASLPHQRDFQTIDLQRQMLVSSAPEDRYNFTYLVFYLLGTATMTPWNFFVTAEDYWMYKFRNTTINGTEPAPELTPMQKTFTCDLTLTASISGTTFLILNAIYGQHVSLRLKMLGTLYAILLFFIVTTVFVEINTDRWQEQFFLITLFTVVIINTCSSIMSGGIFGIAGLFPSEYMTALVSGQALGGIFTALTFLLVLAYGAAPNATAFVFFIIGSVLILFSIVSYGVIERQPFFQYYVDGGDKYEIVCETPSHSRRTGAVVVDTGVALEPNLREVFGKIYVEAVSLCLVFAATLCVYPGVTVLIQSEDFGSGNAWSDIYYLPVVNYLFFNSGDYFGRIVAGVCERPRNSHTVLLLTLLRFLYVPFFLCSNTNLHNFLPTLVHSDTAFILMLISFSLSNGYLANIILIMAPRSVLQHEKETASSIMAASLSLGLALGSMLSMVFVQLL